MINNKSQISPIIIVIAALSLIVLFVMINIFSSHFFETIGAADDIVASRRFCECIARDEFLHLFCDDSDFSFLNDFSSSEEEILQSKIESCRHMIGDEINCGDEFDIGSEVNLIATFIKIPDSCLEHTE